jgi:NTP pyrophosphatase (non-canonical NTP hydrolase)
MELSEYQKAARETDQRPGAEPEDITVHLLGLVGEAGSVASEYKKKLRDKGAHPMWKARMREELGDVLWYLSTLATKLDLTLEDIARSNLEKTRNRWLSTDGDQLDISFPDHEQLPRSGTYEFMATTNRDGRAAVQVYLDNIEVGDLLTDSAYVDDGYRFHDAFHLAYATVLGWSPVTRALLGRKRRSNPAVDENEDGGRAIVVEEGVAAIVFAYAASHNYLDGVDRLDQDLLEEIRRLVALTEVGVRSAADWELAILRGFEMFRKLVANDGGSVTFDADARSLLYKPPPQPS